MKHFICLIARAIVFGCLFLCSTSDAEQPAPVAPFIPVSPIDRFFNPDPAASRVNPVTTDSGLVELQNIANATKCGIFYRYFDLTLLGDRNRCASRRCVTYSLSPPEDDANEIKEQFTHYDGLGGWGRGSIISTRRSIDRNKVAPIPFSTDLSALSSLPKSPIDLILLAAQLGDAGDYIERKSGQRDYCVPYNYRPIIHEIEGVPGRSIPREESRAAVSGTYLCNDDAKIISLASVSTQWAYKDEFDSSKNYIGRGWFNIRPSECMNIDNLLRINGRAVFFVEIGGRAINYPEIPNYDGAVPNYTGFTGFGARDVPMCIGRGAAFRYERLVDAEPKRFSSCGAGMERVHPSLMVRNSSQRRFIVRLRSSGVR